MQELVLDGATYVPLKVAAAQSGYEKNYLGQLCRAGKVDGRLVGRNWYINLESLEGHTALDYGNRGTSAFVAKKEKETPTIFPKAGSYNRTAIDDLPNKNIDISDKVERVHVVPTFSEVNVCSAVDVSQDREEDSLQMSPTMPARVSVIPVHQNLHNQPRVDLTNLLPPPPQAESLVTPRIRPISRYFNDDATSEEIVPLKIDQSDTSTHSSLETEVEILKLEREKRAHQYLATNNVQRVVEIDPLPYTANLGRKRGLSFDWFVPVSVAALSLILLGGVGYVAFEQLAHREYAAGEPLPSTQTASSASFFELLFERRVEYK
jgi:hypothetical protein